MKAVVRLDYLRNNASYFVMLHITHIDSNSMEMIGADGYNHDMAVFSLTKSE